MRLGRYKKASRRRGGRYMLTYKSYRIIDGRPRWVILDKDGNIFNRNPTKEQIKLSANKKFIPKAQRVCCICGSDRTFIQTNGTSSWFRDRDGHGDWTGKWLCNACYSKIQRELPNSYHNVMKYLNQISKNEIKMRKCCRCGSSITYIYNNVPQWFKNIDEKGNWDGISHLCHTCHIKRPGGYGDLRKLMAKIRTNTIAIDRFEELSNRELGVIGEDIVTTKLGVVNYNLESNNLNSSFDIYHMEHRRIDVKIRSLIDNKWEFMLGKNCDTHFLLAMDESIPWKNVEKVYVIPDTEIDITGITITKGIHSRWDRFLVDVKPYDDIYYRKYYLPYKEGTK